MKQQHSNTATQTSFNEKIKIKLLLFSCLTVLLFSCQKEFETEELSSKKIDNKDESKSNFSRIFSGDSLILRNPYTKANMELALNQIKGNYSYKDFLEIDNIQIVTSHYYVKFKPRNQEEEGLLKKDSTLHLFNYRLDCEYSETFLANRVPSNDSIPDYYTAIPISVNMPNVPYDVIDELYIPEQDAYFSDILDVPDFKINSNIANKTDFFNYLLWEAYVNTGNEKELETDDSSVSERWIFGSKWYPSGTVVVHDDIVGNTVPVAGAQILMRQWFTVRSGITAANGTFTTSFVRGHARYIIQWERYHYSIRNGAFFQAETRGPNAKKTAWSCSITNGDNKYHAHIHQAAHDYYYGHRYTLTSPPLNSNSTRQIKIAAREMGNTSSYSHIRTDLTFGISPQISIKQYGSLSDKIYGTTIHELAHAAHQKLDFASYNNLVRDGYFPGLPDDNQRNNKRVLESWARTVETYLTLDRYRNRLSRPLYNYQFENYQLQIILNNNIYTSCGIDMIDDLNQRTFYNNNLDLPADNVLDYNIKQVELGLIGAQTWNQWRDNIIVRYNNNSEKNLYELFNNWQ